MNLSSVGLLLANNLITTVLLSSKKLLLKTKIILFTCSLNYTLVIMFLFHDKSMT